MAQRALMEIGQFTKDIRHIPGLKNVGSDYLSRIDPKLKGSVYQESVNNKPVSVKSDEQSILPDIAALEGHRLRAMSPAVVFQAQEDCKEVKLIEAKCHPTSVSFQRVKFEDSELLCEVSLSKPRPFLPKQLRSFVMKQMHFCHQGVKETNRQIASHYYWHDMKKEITTFVQTCHGCQSVKPSRSKPPHYGFFEVPDQ